MLEVIDLNQLTFGLVLTTLTFLGGYLLWKWCCGDKQEERQPGKKRSVINMQPIYAHEIEPGIVVIQSEDGSYFRILQEYKQPNTKVYGAVSAPSNPFEQAHGQHVSPTKVLPGQTSAYFRTPPGTPGTPPAAPLVELSGEPIVDFGQEATSPYQP